MSGPKYGTAVLEASRRAAISARIQRELEQMKRESEALKKKLEEEKLASLQSQIHILTQKNSRIQSEFLSSGVKEKIKESKFFVSDSAEIEVLEQLLNEIGKLDFQECLCSCSSEAEAVLKKMKQGENALKENIEAAQTNLSVLGVKYSSELVNRKESEYLTKVFKKGAVAIGQEISDSKEYQEFVELAISLGTHQKDIDFIDALISNPALDTPYKFKQIALRMETLSLEQEQSSERDEMLEEISYLQHQLDIHAGIPDTRTERMNHLAELKTQFENKLAEEYINQSIEEVMDECGYNIVRNDLMKNGTRRVEKSFFDYSEDSILQVALSDSGAVMFEVMSRKQSNTITSSDKAAVKSDMERFCPDYQLIRDKLAQKGVILQNEKLMPPNEKYVRSVGIEVPAHSTTCNRRAGTKRKVRYFND